jgi:hypothetical protein
LRFESRGASFTTTGPASCPARQVRSDGLVRGERWGWGKVSPGEGRGGVGAFEGLAAQTAEEYSRRGATNENGDGAKSQKGLRSETLAEIVGTTRPRVNTFMNKFRKLGFIDYNGHLRVHSSLLSVILHE